MSAEAVRELRLRVVYDDQASGPAKQFHQQEQARIRQTRSEQEKSEQAYVRAMYKHLAADKQVAQEKIKGIKDAAKAQAQAHREANALLKQLAKDEQKLANDKAKAEKQAAKDAFAAWKEAMDEQHRLAMQAWKDEQRAARETARARASAHREANALLRQFATDEGRLARQVAAEKKKADRDAFQAWKAEMDHRHALAMQAFEEERQEQAQFHQDMMRTGAAIGTLAGGALATFASHFGRIREDAYRAAEDVMRMRGAVRELQALRGELGNTGGGVAHIMKGAAQTLQTPEEFQAMEAAGLGVGELAIKNARDKEQFEKAMVAAGRMQAIEGGDAGAYGQMMGQIALQSKGPLNAAEMEAKANRLYEIQRPGGFKTMTQAMGQYAGLNAYVMNDVYTPEEAMGLASAFSVSSPESAGTKAEQFTRAVMAGRVRNRGMAVSKDMDMTKSADYFKSIGIGENDSAIARGKKIADDLARQKAAAGGNFNAAEYLMTHGIVNQEDAMAIMDFAGLRNSGRLEKIEAAQNAPLQFGKNGQGALTERFEEQAQKDARLRQRRLEIAGQIQDTEKGIKEEPLLEVQRAAFNELKAQGKVTGTFEEWKNKGTSQRIMENALYNEEGEVTFTPGFGGYHNQVNKRAQEMLRAERERLGLPEMPSYQMGKGVLGILGKSEEEMMQQSAREIRAAGGDPIRDAAKKLDQAAANLERATQPKAAPALVPPLNRGNGVR